MALLAIAALALQPAQAPVPVTSPGSETVTVIDRASDRAEAPPIRSRIVRRASDGFAPDPVAAMYLREWANCIVMMHRSSALNLLSTPLNSPQQERIINELTGYRFARRTVCARFRSMRVDNLVLRGAIAESLYRWEQRRRRTAGPLAAQTPATPTAARPGQLAQMGDCVIGTDPAAAQRVMATRPGTRASRQSLAELSGRIESCLPPGLRPSDFHPLMLRGALGEPFYRHRRIGGIGSST